MNPWTQLGVDPTADERDIKRAYARKLKTTRPDDDPTGYQVLREAYEAALEQAQYARARDARGEAQAVEPAPEAPANAMGAQPVPPPVPPHPMEEARRIWTEFVSSATVQPRQRLAKFMAREDMLDLQVRECFELCAVQYCASDGCPDNLRVAIAEFYGWEDNASAVGHLLPDATYATLAHLRAQRSYDHFLGLASKDKAVRAILASDAGHGIGRTWSSGFTRKMQQLIEAVRVHHPEMLHYKLDRGVFETWERRVQGRRYFVQTALYSAVCGQLMFYAARWGLSAQGLAGFESAAFLLSYLLSFVLIGWFALSSPKHTSRLPQTLYVRLRYHPLVQFGWIGLFALASTVMYVPNPGPILANAITAGLLVALVIGTFANTVAIAPFGFLIATIVGFSLGGMLSEVYFQSHGMIACVAGALMGMQLLYRGGSDLADYLGLDRRTLLALRGAWYVGTAALLLVGAWASMPAYAFAAVAWVWVMFGMLLIRPSVHHAFALGGAFIAQFMLLAPLPKSSLLKQATLPLIIVALLAIAIFMAVNMKRAQTNQHQFT